MNIEDLSKSQLLLLTIMVNFVVSIATGVLVVSLLSQSPVTVTQTVSQIVDHTIETISSSTPIQIPTVTIAKPPVATPAAPTTEQLLTSAISGEVARSVSIYKDSTTTSVIAVGTYLPKSRAVATASATNLPANVIIQFSNGETVSASLSHAGATVTIYGFGDTVALPKAAQPTLVASSELKQGDTVIAITADHSALTGIVSKVDDTGVHTTLPVIPPGAQAVNLAGNVVGISGGTAGLFFPAERITTLLSATSTSPAP